MNGRTCQLCGKALSRFTVGSGGDFCSREHRNQFRLRLGMDRLQEANKVANLMRRRENAKAIPSSQLARDSKVQPRLAAQPRFAVRPPTVHLLKPLTAALETPRIIAQCKEPLPFRQPPTARNATARPAGPGSFTDRRVRPVLPPRTAHFQAQIAAAGALIRHVAGARIAERRREAGEPGLSLHRTHIGGTGIQLRPLRIGTQNCQEPQRPRRLNNSADRGQELRVSGGIGFRLPATRIRRVEFAAPQTTPPNPSAEPLSLNAARKPREYTVATSGAVPFLVRNVLAPTPPEQNNGPGFRWPDALTDGAPGPRQAADTTRICAVEWTGPAPRPPQLRHTNGLVRLRPTKPPVPFVTPPQPRTLPSEPRLTLVSFRPRETPFECSPTALFGTLVSGMHFGATPLRKVDAAPATLEEHFDAGLRNWLGGTDDWRVDVAGVRAGSLALYTPSLDIPNYLLEFLTRIESRGVTWVFRAAGFSDYYQATLALVAGGGYELRRHAVIGGAAEPPTVLSVPAPVGKTAVTIRTRVSGDEFTVSLDGQVLETWTDARLPAGGIGFIGAPEDRARLYWVRVTPTGHPIKEYLKR